MSESLRDQLLKSGLAKKLKPEPKPQKPAAKSSLKNPSPTRPSHHANPKPITQSKKEELDLARAYAMRAKVERDERDSAQREAERVARERKERKAKLTSLLSNKILNNNDAHVARHFPHGNKIRRIYVTADQLPKLNAGELAVVQLAGRYLLVEKSVALQAQEIQPESLVLLCDPNADKEDDVPDDLVW